MAEAGKTAPSFSLLNQDRAQITLESLAGKEF